MIETLLPKTPHEALALGIHVWMEAQDHLHIGSTCNIVELRSELSIAIANEKPRSTIERGIAKLLGSPLLRRMIRLCVIDDLPRIVLHDDEGENLSEADIVRLQEIAGPYLMCMVLKER